MPRHGGPGGQVNEKSKDFIGSMKRLLTHLKSWQIGMYLSLIFAGVSAILTLISPDKLSELTDTITVGIKPNVEVLETISLEMINNLNNDSIKEKIPLITNSTDLSDEDKKSFNDAMLKLSKAKDENEALGLILMLPSNVLKILLDEIVIDDVIINVDDQLEIIRLTSNSNFDSTDMGMTLLDSLPDSVYSLVVSSIDIDKVLGLAYFIGGLYLVSAILSYTQNFTMTTISNKFAKSLRTSINSKINILPLKYFDTHEIGDVLSRITNDVDMIAHNLNQSLATLVTSITLFFGSIIMMFITNWVMAITAIVASLVGFLFMAVILGRSQKYFAARQEELGHINGYIEEIYSGHNVVKVYNGKNKAIREFDELNKKMYEVNKKSQFLSGLMHPIMAFVGNLGYVAVCLVGALLVHNDAITFGVIIAFMVYVRLFNNPLTQMAQAMTSLQSTVAASERVFEFLDEKEMSDQKEIKKHLAKSKIKGKIEFKNVKFGYDLGRTIIKDFSVTVNPGQKVAIVGPTGAGKTTIVNLLMKFYEINDGDILIDGVSIKELSRENIHDLFCMVLQDTWLFEGTVGENIRFNKKDVDDKEIWEVCRVVGVDHFVKTLPGGLDAVLGDNESVSGGQKQLFTIARGMLEDAPFLILDEATSNVDTRTEELVQKAMDKLTEGRTSFIIAHRLSTIKNADLILVMKEGNIVEMGTHNELMNKDGFYAELYNSQFEL